MRARSSRMPTKWGIPGTDSFTGEATRRTLGDLRRGVPPETGFLLLRCSMGAMANKASCQLMSMEFNAHQIEGPLRGDVVSSQLPRLVA